MAKKVTYNLSTISAPMNAPGLSVRHIHSVYEILFIQEGNVDYMLNGQKYRLKKNDLVFTRPMVYHLLEFESNANYTRFNLTFDEKAVGEKLLSQVPPDVDVVNCPEDGIIADIFTKMRYYSEKLPEDSFKDLLRCLIKEVLYNITLSSRDIITIPSDISPMLKQALQYIDAHFSMPLNVEELCTELFVSPSYFFKLFKKTLKLSPKQYINLKRLYYAQKLIRSGKKPTQIYGACGFETYVGFYKQYVKTFGYPPSKES